MEWRACLAACPSSAPPPRSARLALEVFGNLRKLELPGLDGVDRRRRLRLDVEPLPVLLAHHQRDDGGAVAAEERDLARGFVEPVARRVLALRRDDLLPLEPAHAE